MALIAQTKERYLRSPRIEALADGARLWVVAWERDGERLLSFPLGADGEPGEPTAGPLLRGIVALAPGSPPEPSDDAADELRAASRGAFVEVVHTGGVSEVWMSRGGGDRILVFRARCTVASPAVADAPNGGTWVAFHHDLREDVGTVDVAKWVALRFVTTDRRVMEPAAPMLGRDRDRADVEQSFEFPALAVSADGSLALFGRGSHNFWRQDLNATGFSPRVGISDGEWGSRGRRVSCGMLGDGALLVARRDRQGIVIDRQGAPSGGAPVLEPAEIDLTTALVLATGER
ncbi:MAG: hypothetical protein H5U40_03800, partial [Polyangiaceae bacterium]|nr:hypothetical protein [Polyangiaceae bacterium]